MKIILKLIVFSIMAIPLIPGYLVARMRFKRLDQQLLVPQVEGESGITVGGIPVNIRVRNFIGLDELLHRTVYPQSMYRLFAQRDEPGGEIYILANPAMLRLPLEVLNALLWHEVGHIVLGHLDNAPIGLVMDPAYEYAADEYAATKVGADVYIKSMKLIKRNVGKYHVIPNMRKRIRRLSKLAPAPVGLTASCDSTISAVFAKALETV